jgi:hypothetical protein
MQPALAVDAFRVLAGGLLSVRCAQDARFIPQLVLDGLWHPSAPASATLFSALSTAVGRLGPNGLRAWFVLGAVLGALIALGCAPRICAALLLVISAASYYMIRPAVTLDDYFAEAVPFWLVLLPIGRTLTPFALHGHRSWVRDRVNGWPSLGCLAFVLIYLIELTLVETDLPKFAGGGFFAAAVLAVAPIRVWRALAVVPAAVGLWAVSRLEGAAFSWRASAALCVVFVAMVAANRPHDNHAEEVVPMGLSATIGGAAVVLLAVQALAMNVGIPAVAESTGAVLANVGLPWSWQARVNDAQGAPLDVAFRLDEGTPLRPEGLDAGNGRLQAVLRLLGRSSSKASDHARSMLIRGLMVRHCRNADIVRDAPVAEYMMVLRNGRPLRGVGWFQCGRPGEDPKMVQRDFP